MSTLNIDKSDQHVKPDRDELAIAFLRRVLPPEGPSCKDNSSRKAANTVALKAFFADIDVDTAKAAKGAGYASIDEVRAALRKFL